MGDGLVQPKVSIQDFARRIREKDGAYDDVDDFDLVEAVVRKNPVYADRVELPEGFSFLGGATSGHKKIDELYERKGRQYNVDPRLLLEQGRQETSFDPDVWYGRRGSPKAARGSGQFIPGTAKRFNVDVNNPESGVDGQARYMRELLDMFDDDEDLALAGYNAGEHRQSLREGKIPPIEETQNYVKTIREKLGSHRASRPGDLRRLLGTAPTPTTVEPVAPVTGVEGQPPASPLDVGVPPTEAAQSVNAAIATLDSATSTPAGRVLANSTLEQAGQVVVQAQQQAAQQQVDEQVALQQRFRKFAADMGYDLTTQESLDDALAKFNAVLETEYDDRVAQNEQDRNIADLQQIGDYASKGQKAPIAAYHEWRVKDPATGAPRAAELPDTKETAEAYNTYVGEQNAKAEAELKASPGYASYQEFLKETGLPDTPESQAEFNTVQGALREQGAPSREAAEKWLATPNARQQQPTVTAGEPGKAYKVEAPRGTGKPTDSDNVVDYTVEVDPSWTPEQKMRHALSQKFTPDEVDKFIANPNNKDRPGPAVNSIDIPRYITTQIRGAEESKFEARTEQARSRLEPTISREDPGPQVSDDASKEQLHQEYLADELAKQDPDSYKFWLRELLKSPLQGFEDWKNILTKGDIERPGRKEAEAAAEQRLEAARAKHGSYANVIKQRQRLKDMPGLGHLAPSLTEVLKGAFVDNFAPILETGGIIQNAFNRYTAFNRGLTGYDPKAEETGLYKAGQVLRETFEQGLPDSEASIGSQAGLELERPLGQVLGTLLMTASGVKFAQGLGLPVGTTAGSLGVGGTVGISQQVSEAYGRAKKSGATEDQAYLAAILAAPGGALEGLSDAMILNKLGKIQKLDKATGGLFSTRIVQRLKNAAGEFGKQGATEWLLEEVPQTLISDTAARLAYEKDGLTYKGFLKDFDNAIHDTAITFLVGGLVGGGAGLAQQVETREQPTPTPQAQPVAQQIEPLAAEVPAAPKEVAAPQATTRQLSRDDKVEPGSTVILPTGERATVLADNGKSLEVQVEGRKPEPRRKNNLQILEGAPLVQLDSTGSTAPVAPTETIPQSAEAAPATEAQPITPATTPAVPVARAVEDFSPAAKQAQGEVFSEADFDAEFAEPMRSVTGQAVDIRVATPEEVKQTSWFGESKAVDKSGRPQPMFHGTNSDVEAFDEGDVYAGWFSPDPQYASKYASRDSDTGSQVIPVYLAINNPVVIPPDINQARKIQDENLEQFARATKLPLAELQKISTSHDYLWELVKSQEFKDLAEKRGYDGIRQTEFGSEAWAAFHPEQIKSIFNRGTFDPNDPHILHKVRTREAGEEHLNMKNLSTGRVLNSGVTAQPTQHGLEVSSAGMELLRRMELVYDKRDAPVQDGMFMDPKTAKRIAGHVTRFIDKYESKFPEHVVTALRGLEKQMHDIGDGGKVVYVFDDAVGHERLHQLSFMLAGGKGLVDRHGGAEALLQFARDNRALIEKAYEAHYGLRINGELVYGYEMPNLDESLTPRQVVQVAILVEEMAVSSMDGDFATIGLTSREAAQYVKNWLDSYAATNGKQAIQQFADFIDSLQRSDTTVLEAVREKLHAENVQTTQAESVQTAEAGTEPGQPEADSERPPDVPEGTEPAGGSAARQAPSDTGKERERQTVVSAERAGVVKDVPDQIRYYNQKSKEENKRKAQDRIENIGLAAAYSEATQPATEGNRAEHTALQMELAQLLNRQAREAAAAGDMVAAKAKLNSAQEIVSAMALAGTDYGQAISQLGEWQKEDPDAVTGYVQKRRAQIGYNQALTPEQAEGVRDAATTAAELQATVDDLRQQIAKLEAEHKGETPAPRKRTENKDVERLEKNKQSIIQRLLNDPLRSVAQTKTPAFRRWFGRSKIVDENGEPLVVYHGTAIEGTTDARDGQIPIKAFTEFRKDLRGSVTGTSDSKMGFWFTSSDARAIDAAGDAKVEAETNGVSAYVYDVYLKIENPLVFDSIWQYGPSEIARFARQAKTKGHDGLIFKQGEGGEPDYLVFEPTQIKSAIGNRGTFDPEDPNILRKVSQLGAAPMREGQITDLNKIDDAFEGKEFVQFNTLATDLAKELGLNLKSQQNTIGVWSNTSSLPEVSLLPVVEGEDEDVELYAALLGTLAPEVQDSVMQLVYDKDAPNRKYEIKFDSPESAKDMIARRAEFGIANLSFEPATNTVILVEDGPRDLTALEDAYGDRIESFKEFNVNARFYGEDDYRSILENGERNARASGPVRARIQTALERLAAPARSVSIRDRDRVRGGTGVLADPYGSNQGTRLTGSPGPLEVDGRLIQFTGYKPAQDLARSYMQRAGLPYIPNEEFVPLDRERAKRIADEFDKMEHAPNDPQVRAAYQAMIDETTEQYREILKSGLKIEFIDYAKQGDPYDGNPRRAILDVVENNHLWVFSTRDGFGSDESFDASQNPLLQPTEFEISGQPALANDLFRVVHDYFGHIKDGVGFRARGEENAWKSHSRMYSPLARRAMTSETRGQNSWVNFGPHAEHNKTASSADTIYADQKLGLMPDWVSETEDPLRSVSRKDGEVLGENVYYHASDEEVRDYAGGSDLVYFTKNKEFAEEFGEVLNKAEVVLKNPYDFEKHQGEYHDSDGNEITIGWLNENPDVVDDLVAKGYDGAVAGDEFVVPFDNSQIKPIQEEFDEGTLYRVSTKNTSTVPLMQDPEKAKKDLGLHPEERNKVRRVGEVIQKRTEDMGFAVPRDDRSAGLMKRIAKAMVEEIKYHLGTKRATGTGLGWYSVNYPRALKKLAKIYPEFKQKNGAKELFTAVLAITSNGEEVGQNLTNAMQVYDQLRRGVSPTKIPLGTKQQRAYRKNMESLEHLLKNHGPKGMVKVLLEEQTVRDIEAGLKARGEKPKTGYAMDAVLPAAALYFGPKLGAFYANLMGSEGYLTMDMWWTRMFNRHRGQLLPEPTESSIENLRQLLGQDGVSDNEILQQTPELMAPYKAREFKTELEVMLGRKEGGEKGTKVEKEAFWKIAKETVPARTLKRLEREHEIEKKANTIYKAAFDELEQVPYGPGDRAFMWDTTKAAQEMLATQGVHLSVADIQAALWYYEKRLYENLTNEEAVDIGYEEAIKKVAAADRPRRPTAFFDRQAKSGRNRQTAETSFDEEEAPLRSVSPAKPESGFYSQVERTLEQKMPNKASADQVRGILKDAKKEELDWLDINSFLADNPNPTKQEVLDYIRANNVEVREVMKGENNEMVRELIRINNTAPGYINADDATKKYREASSQLISDIASDRISLHDAVLKHADLAEEVYGEEYEDTAPWADGLQMKLAMLAEGYEEGGSVTKFHQHTLPGGENYRELLLTMPDEESAANQQARMDYRAAIKAGRPEAELDALSDKVQRTRKPDAFKSSHFDEPNILAHVRFDDRDGGKTLHIAEIQSDWHQQGRKKGYTKSPTRYTAREDEETGLWNVYAANGDEVALSIYASDEAGAIEQARELEREEGLDQAGGVPDAPFKQSWPLMAFKRVLRYAVENGYERVTWDTGETSAERYDLSKQVKKIVVIPNSDGNRVVRIDPIDGTPFSLIVDVNGIVDGHGDAAQFTGKSIEDVVGKEMGRQIMDAAEGLTVTLSGADLEVGGEGMKGFYDKILPKEVGKYVKKWGGKVEAHEVATKFRKKLKPGQTMTEATTPVHSLEITPSMKESIEEEGQPLYSVTPDEKKLLADYAAIRILEDKTHKEVIDDLKAVAPRASADEIADAHLAAWDMIYPHDSKATQTERAKIRLEHYRAVQKARRARTATVKKEIDPEFKKKNPKTGPRRGEFDPDQKQTVKKEIDPEFKKQNPKTGPKKGEFIQLPEKESARTLRMAAIGTEQDLGSHELHAAIALQEGIVRDANEAAQLLMDTYDLEPGEALNAASKGAKFRQEANKQINQENKERQAKIDELKGKLPREVKKASTAQRELLRRIESLEKPPPSYSARLARVYKGALVSAVQTSVNNFLTAQGTRGVVKLTDLVELVLNKGLRKAGRELRQDAISPDVSVRDVLGIPKEQNIATAVLNGLRGSVFSKGLADSVLNEFPTFYEELFSSYASDIDVMPEKTGPGKAGEKAMRAAEWTVDKVNILNRLQEFLVRSQEFTRTLQLRLAGKGEDLQTMIDEGRVRDIDAADLKHAVREALRVTFAMKPDPNSLFGRMVNMYESKTPALLAPLLITFPRFAYNATNFITDYAPGIGLVKAGVKGKQVGGTYAQGFKEVNSRDIAKQLVGTSIFLAALGLVRALGDDDDWYNLKVPGYTIDGKQAYIDVRGYQPFASFIFMANKVNRVIEGKPMFSDPDKAFWEITEAMLGLSQRNIAENKLLAAAFAGGKWATGLGDDKEWERVTYLMRQQLGEIAGGFMRPLKTVKDLVSQFDAWTKENGENVQPDLVDRPEMQGIARSLPFSNQLMGAEPKKDFVTGKVSTQPAPGLKVLGVTIANPDFNEPPPSNALVKIRELDEHFSKKDVLPEAQKERAIKGSIWRAIREAGPDVEKQKAVIDALKRAEETGGLSEGQVKYIKQGIGLTELQSRLKATEWKNVVQTLSVMTKEEIESVRPILDKKINSERAKPPTEEELKVLETYNIKPSGMKKLKKLEGLKSLSK